MASFQQDLSSAFGTLANAARLSLSNAAILLPLAALVGGLGHMAMWKFGLFSSTEFADALAQQFKSCQGQDFAFLASELGKMVAGMAWGLLLYPLIDAATIYIWRQDMKGEPAGFGGALNWSLNRYGRMFIPHAAAFLTITFGMIVLVPGILFGLMYAFTDAIAATDPKATRPLARSEKLTRGRRRRIALSWVPYALWYLPAYLVLVYQAEDQSRWQDMTWLAVLAFGTLDVFLLQIMEMTMYGLYEERIEDARRAIEARQGTSPAGELPGEAPPVQA